ncbi:MAG: bifunctional diaminohydroxyphosphoribosylaminopyrimidine deaminase/5-amino-6-(5-phosphoribosylamino)uracil reductase RibD [Pseudomonadota bacterium]
MTWTQQDYQFMSRAMQLARRGQLTCKPNPEVGCVIVRQGDILNEGWHQFAGEAHAEINALNNVNDVANAIVYVTLEPCAHHGLTPPCVDSLIEAKVSEVVIAMEDPNPLVSGKGIEKLRAAGILVRQGLLKEQAQEINKGFIKRMQVGLPYVTCKMAMSLDGRTALANGDSQWISSIESRRDVHRIRAMHGAILSSANTVNYDNAKLSVRDFHGEFIQPVRVIIDRQGKIDKSSVLFSEPGDILIYTQAEHLTIMHEQTKVIHIHEKKEWLLKVFQHLAVEYQLNNILVECGADLSSALIKNKLIDELIVYLAPKILGSDAAALSNITGIQNIDDCYEFILTETRQFGTDLRLTYRLH